MGIGVIAKLSIKPGSGAAFEKTFHALQAQVQENEKGCRFYQIFKSRDEENTYVVMEHYASQADLDAHGKTDYFRAAGRDLGKVLAGAPEVTLFDAVG